MDGNEHAALSSQEYREGIQAQLDRLAELERRTAEYERRFGPLS